MLLAFLLMAASGFAGLAYQIVWTQQSTSWLGHESAAVLAVVAAFFAGLALGALMLGARVDRSAQPARWYAGCEIVVGLWSVTLAVVLEPVSSVLLGAIGPQPSATWHWFVAFFGTALLLLPATVAMGATLPAMERVFATTASRNFSISALYAANTAGAVVGVIAAAFWLVPQLGLAHSALVCATLNFICAGAALCLQTNSASRTPERGGAVTSHRKQALVLLALTGMFGIGYEVLVVRALSQVAENTVYTFALLLAVYLVGTTLGAAAYSRWRAAKDVVLDATSDGLRTFLIQALAIACLLGTLLLARANEVKNSIIGLLGASVAAALTGEAATAFVAFLLPTIVMGALFSHLSTEARDRGISFGHAVGVNTLGAAVAPLIFGVVLLPALGLKLGLLLICAGYLLLAARAAWSRPTQWLTIVAIAASVIWSPPPANVHLPRGGQMISNVEGVMASVSVIEDESGVATLHINNRQQEGSSATLLADARQALIPMLLHPNPKHALFLGLGTGLTASSATLRPSLQVDVVELVPEVIEAAQYFQTSYSKAADRSRLRTMAADARRFVRTSKRQYDVIVADNFHPARSGSAALYTVEHFQAVRQRLAAGGVFCQWLPLHQLDLETLKSIVQSFLTAYPNASAVLATLSLDTPTIGLIARRDGELFDRGQLQPQVSAARSYDGFGIPDDLALLGSFFAGPRSLATFADGAPLNTDDRPSVAYRAPAMTYSPESTARERLLELLGHVEISPQEILAGEPNSDWITLANYWTARDRFIEAGRAVRATSDVRDMLAQVRGPLMEVLRISPDFRPAYDPLIRMAASLARVDSATARSLLSELQQAQPDRPEAAQLLDAISAQ